MLEYHFRTMKESSQRPFAEAESAAHLDAAIKRQGLRP